MTEKTASKAETWTNAPEGFDPSDNALHARFPEGYIVVQVDQGRTPSTVDSPPEGYREFPGVTLYGTELSAAISFAADLRASEGYLHESVKRVPSSSFEVIFAARWQEDREPVGWLFDPWREGGEGGEVVYHAFAGDAEVHHG